MEGDPAPLAFDAPLLLVGGAPLPAGLLEEAEALTARTVAADGGADALDAAGRSPEAVIGDMDSVADPAAWRARLGPRFLHVPEQDSTDLQKCLRLTRAPLTVGIGFLGARLDHTLAALSALARAAPRPVLLIGPEDCAIHLPPRWSARLGAGTPVSLFPMGKVRLSESEGLEWPADGIDFRPLGPIGTSNRASADRVRLAAEGPGMLLLAPRAQAAELARSLSEAG